MRLVLPYPPSVNHYWRFLPMVGKVVVSEGGKDFRRLVAVACRNQVREKAERFAAGEDLAVMVEAFPPDDRERDLDNLEKSLFDSLAHADIYNSDAQIKSKLTFWRPGVRNGRVVVTIELARDLIFVPQFTWQATPAEVSP